MTIIGIKADASPIDNVKKFAWYDEDYVEITVPDKIKPAADPGKQFVRFEDLEGAIRKGVNSI